MKYTNQPVKKRWPRRVAVVVIGGLIIIGGATAAVRYAYNYNLKPLSNSQEVRSVTIEEGDSIEAISQKLETAQVIRSAWAFRLYVSSKEVGSALQAGSYEFVPAQTVPEIVSHLSRGKVATNLVTILPGQRIDQVRTRFTQDGFTSQDINVALDPASYAGHPALVDKPAGASLEGYLYPESYQKTTKTSANTIVKASLEEMNARLTPDIRSAFAAQGLSTYQAITLASIVEREVPKQQDRDQVAQVFLKRIRQGMALQSDATTTYGAVLAGKNDVKNYESAYNTYTHTGLPPTPISNVTLSSLKAVSRPATTDWLYFVSGDDGTTHFSKTLAEHEANIDRYCKVLCS